MIQEKWGQGAEKQLETQKQERQGKKEMRRLQDGQKERQESQGVQGEGQESRRIGGVRMESQRTDSQRIESGRIESLEQRRRLREFDKELFSYTGQIAWLLPGIFSFIVLILMCIPVQEIEKGDHLVWITAFVGIWISYGILLPYINITDTFERQKNNRNRTYDKLKYLPVSGKQYIIVRMGYLFRFVWKLTAAGTAAQCIFAAVGAGGAELVNVAYAVGVLMIIPLAAGWLQLKIAVLSS